MGLLVCWGEQSRGSNGKLTVLSVPLKWILSMRWWNASHQNSVSVEPSRVKPFGHSTSEETKTCRWDPSIHAFSILPLLSFISPSSQSVQYIHLRTQRESPASSPVHYKHKCYGCRTLITSVSPIPQPWTTLTSDWLQEDFLSSCTHSWTLLLQMYSHEVHAEHFTVKQGSKLSSRRNKEIPSLNWGKCPRDRIQVQAHYDNPTGCDMFHAGNTIKMLSNSGLKALPWQQPWLDQIKISALSN